MVHLNIKSAKKNFEKLKDFLSQTGSFFNVLYLTQTWFNDRNSESSLYQLPQYTTMNYPQHKSSSHKSGQGDGISIYIHDSLNFKYQKDLGINTKNVASL